MKIRKLKESEILELKKSTSELKEAIISIVSILNKHQKGELYFGIKTNREVIGQTVTEKTIRDISKTISDKIEPKIFPKIKEIVFDGKKCVLVEFSGSDKPYYAYGRAYMRVGDEDKKLSSQELEKLILKKNKDKLMWDKEICKEAVLKDIDWNFIEKSFIPSYTTISKRKTISKAKELLESLKCLRKNKPTNAGILLFNKEPQKFFMNAYIALARYKGNIESIERLDYKEFTGNLFQQIDECDKYIKKCIAVMSRLHPYKTQREDIPEYSLFSIRELITNAICHRNYSEQRSKIIVKIFKDKIKFYNPGGLPKDINPKNILRKQYSRNPIIANVLAKVGYIEELGEGWNKIIDEHKKHPLKPKLPKIEADKESISVTLFSTKEKFEKKKIETRLNERQKYVLETIKSQGFIKSIDIQKKFDITRDTANRDLNYLIKLKLIKRKGAGKSITYTE